MPVVSVSLPKSLLEDVDRLEDEEGYASRSELFRASLRNYFNEYKVREKLEGTLSGFISIMYALEDKACSKTIKEIHHSHDQIVQGSLHLHFDEQNCFDIWVIKGQAENVMTLIENLKAVRGSKHVGHDLISIK